jgi:hypothetical protein
MCSISQAKERVAKISDGQLREYAVAVYRKNRKLSYALNCALRQLEGQGELIRKLKRNQRPEPGPSKFKPGDKVWCLFQAYSGQKELIGSAYRTFVKSARDANHVELEDYKGRVMSTAYDKVLDKNLIELVRREYNGRRINNPIDFTQKIKVDYS